MDQLDEVTILHSRNDDYRLVNGETRLKAIKEELELDTIKVKIVEYDAKNQLDEDLQFKAHQAITNLRVLTPPVEGWAKFVFEYERLLSKKYPDLTQKEIIEEILHLTGNRSSSFYQTCKLIVSADSDMRDFIENGLITAWAILEIDNLSDEAWKKGFIQAVKKYAVYKRDFKERKKRNPKLGKMITMSARDRVRELKHIAKWAKEANEITSAEEKQQFAHDLFLSSKNIPGYKWQKQKYALVYKKYKQGKLEEETGGLQAFS